MNFTDTRLFLELAIVFWNVGLTAAIWLRKPGTLAIDAVSSLRTHVDVQFSALREKTIALEERVKHMPTSEELAELEGTVKSIDVRTEGLNENMATVRAQLNRIENYLLNTK